MPTVRSPTLKLNSPCYPCVCLSRDRYYVFELGHLEFVYGLPWRAMLESSVVLVRDQIPYSTYNEA